MIDVWKFLFDNNSFSAVNNCFPDSVSGSKMLFSSTIYCLLEVHSLSLYTDVELIKITFSMVEFSINGIILSIFDTKLSEPPFLNCGGISIIKIVEFARKGFISPMIFVAPIEIIKGFIFAFSNAKILPGVVVDPLIEKPFLIKLLAKSKPNQPQPKIEICLFIFNKL